MRESTVAAVTAPPSSESALALEAERTHVESELTEDEPEPEPVATPGIESVSTTADDDVPET
jgi:hypothetical protein